MAALTDFVDFSQLSLQGMFDIIFAGLTCDSNLCWPFAVTALSIAFNPIFWK